MSGEVRLTEDLNIIIEQGIGLTSKGKHFNITMGFSGANLFTNEAIFLLSYKNYFSLLICLVLFYSCIKEIDITEFSDQYGDFEQELRVEALILPADSTAIIRIDKTISIDNETLFNCEDDNGNWVASGCVCEQNTCPENVNDCDAVGGLWLITESNPFLDGYCNLNGIVNITIIGILNINIM